MENNEYMVTIDQIVDCILNNEASGSKNPEFVQICEKNVAKELLNYTVSVSKAIMGRKISEEEAMTITEDKASSVLDVICECNRTFFKRGMQFSASLLFQLLG